MTEPTPQAAADRAQEEATDPHDVGAGAALGAEPASVAEADAYSAASELDAAPGAASAEAEEGRESDRR